MNRLVRDDISLPAKQAFQVVALLATILVVGIHYQSDVPDSPSVGSATWNELLQEFMFGGIARVAVPMFAFAAGFFYFRTDDGTLATYRSKLSQRLRTVAFPFFIVASISTAAWLVTRRLEGDPPTLTLSQFFSTWLLRPPAEQLWFLRDLMVLVTVAPLIRLCGVRPVYRLTLVTVLGAAWAIHLPGLPIVAGWHVVHWETAFFFVLGAAAVWHTAAIERMGQFTTTTVAAVCALWCTLILARISLRADFDIWYVDHYGLADLWLHQASIVVGCCGLYMVAWRLRHEWIIRLSGASFFVYLVHEFPLRAIVERVSDRYLESSTSCWIVLPLVIVGCFGAAFVLSRLAPSCMGILTGGRTPMSAARISGTEHRTESPDCLSTRAAT